MAIITLLSLGGYIYISMFNPRAAFFLLPFRFWELGLGCLSYLAARKYSNARIRFSEKLTYIVFFIMVIFFFPPSDLQIAGTLAARFSRFILLIILTKSRKSVVQQLLNAKYVQYIGKISYSL